MTNVITTLYTETGLGMGRYENFISRL